MTSNSHGTKWNIPTGIQTTTLERPTAYIEPILPEVVAQLLQPRGIIARPSKPSNKRRAKASSAGKRGPRLSHGNSATFSVPPASPIDTLASIALQNSPIFNHSPPTTFHNLYQSQFSPAANGSHSVSYDQHRHPEERASKRARSEVLRSREFEDPNASRPQTSYNGWGYSVEQGIDQRQRIGPYHIRSGSANSPYKPQETNVDEAELLLNFSRGGSLSELQGLGIHTHTGTPPQQTVTKLPPCSSESSDHVMMDAPATTADKPTFPVQDSPQPVTGPADMSFEREDSQSITPLKETTGSIISNEPLRAHTDLIGQSSNDQDDMDNDKSTPVEAKETLSVDHSGGEIIEYEPTSLVERVQSPIPTIKEVEAQTNGKNMTSLKTPVTTTDTTDNDDNHSSKLLNQASFEESQLGNEARSPSLPPSAATGDVSHTDAAMESQAPTDSNLRLHEQGIICPSCKFAADVMSERVDWLQCDGCDEWYHAACAGYSAKQSERIDKYYCKACVPKFGKSTLKRKSTRVRTTVDYAGLNEGVLRMPDESREHHYIESFKSGNVILTPETFPRIPGKEITAEFFQKSFSFFEPVVIPSSMNPRPKFPGTSSRDVMADDDHEWIPDDGQDDMDMVIPQELTVRRVSNLYGPKNQIPVIDVKVQESSKGWTVEKWADYYENPGDKPIRNVISLECTTTPLARLIKRPKVVRDLDLQDSVWPDTEWRKSVGFYVLMSVADCFTDFHIDFGGSSVYYHILKGRKVFFFIPPTPSNLQKYQDWNNMPSQNWTWLPDQTKTKECYRIDLYPGDTMLIPAGWIHAVWTPEDSLVIGGNFLTRLHYAMQFKVAEVEKANKTPVAFRYPKFQKVMWYVVLQYLEQDPLPESVRETFWDGKQFTRQRPIWSDVDKYGENSDSGPENYNARYYPKAELDGLPDMVNFIFRTVMIYLDRLENITKETRKAVTESIPKNRGEPLDNAQNFALWVAWKRGNEDIPEWAHPGAVLPNKPEEPAEKKLSDAQFKRMQKASAIDVPERQSARLKSVAESAMLAEQAALTSSPKTSTLGPRRTACDSCRKRKMRCKHVENSMMNSSPIPFPSPESAPARPLVGVVIPAQAQPPTIAAYVPPLPTELVMAFDRMSEPPSTMPPGPKQEVTELKKGRTKACYDCRRSKRRCIHDEYGQVDPIKQREPVVPRGAAKRKQGPSPELPLAKKPANDQIAPIAPMMGHPSAYDVSPPPPGSSSSWSNSNMKQDGMFRNSTVSDFSGTMNGVNVNPLASLHRSGSMGRQSSGNGSQSSPSRPGAMDWVLDPALVNPDFKLEGLDTAAQRLGDDHTDDEYADAQDALSAYLQYNVDPHSHGASQESMQAQQHGSHGQNGLAPKTEVDSALGPIDDMTIDPALGVLVGTAVDEIDTAITDSAIDPTLGEVDLPRNAQVEEQATGEIPLESSTQLNGLGITNTSDAAQAITNGVNENDHSIHNTKDQIMENGLGHSNGFVHPNGVLPSTESYIPKQDPLVERQAVVGDASGTSTKTPPKRRKSSALLRTPFKNGGDGEKSTSPDVSRSRYSMTPGSKSGGRIRAYKLDMRGDESAIEEADDETKRLIEQLRREDLETRGLRRRS